MVKEVQNFVYVVIECPLKEHYSLAPETFVRSKSTILFMSHNFSIENFITIFVLIKKYHFQLKVKEYLIKIVILSPDITVIRL